MVKEARAAWAVQLARELSGRVGVPVGRCYALC